MAGSINLGFMNALKREDGIKIDQNHQTFLLKEHCQPCMLS
jgi:hypothetical protein